MEEPKPKTEIETVQKPPLLTQLKQAWNADPAPGTSKYDYRWQRCAENFAVTASAGFVSGLTASFLVFKSPRLRMLTTGVFTGMGSSVTTCRLKVFSDPGKKN
eukprot:snap_masked-scaffold_13-processed-gene-1.35-mRNA-1 protein AED:1.00 eAED:1.00 QI:0/0/0/0/1/1/2/0/102